MAVCIDLDMPALVAHRWTCSRCALGTSRLPSMGVPLRRRSSEGILYSDLDRGRQFGNVSVTVLFAGARIVRREGWGVSSGPRDNKGSSSPCLPNSSPIAGSARGEGVASEVSVFLAGGPPPLPCAGAPTPPLPRLMTHVWAIAQCSICLLPAIAFTWTPGGRGGGKSREA